jgi:uncharacterized protein
MSNIIEKIRQFAEAECKKPTSSYGAEPYTFHFVPMVGYAKALAKDMGADQEIVEIASWLHDLGSIIYGRKDHHQTGTKIAEEKLGELGYPKEKIERVKACILHHRGSTDFLRLSIEEQVIAEADAMSNFDNISGIFKAAFVYENLDQGEARRSVYEKLERKWKQLKFAKSKEIIRPKYEAVKLLLGGKSVS